MVFYLYADSSFIFEVSRDIFINVVAALIAHRILHGSKKTH
jgi:hypothetical protein